MDSKESFMKAAKVVRGAVGGVCVLGFAFLPGCSSSDGASDGHPDGSATGGKPAAGGSQGASGGSQAATGGSTSSTGGSTSSTGGTGSGAGGQGPTVSCSAEEQRSGQATFYTFADGSGNCSFDESPDDLMIGAMNAADYAASAACGACAALDGPNGSVTVRIVDQCPDCPKGNIDLSPEAFDHIAERSQGRVSITWKYVPCDISTPISYRFKEGSSQYWTAVQVRNHRNAIARFEYQKSGAFVDVHREDYNYFVEGSGMGPGPYTFRLTDVYGNVVTDSGVAFKEAQVVSGTVQFPRCAP
jgi:expansin (peptidoglycan-binding protein)